MRHPFITYPKLGIFYAIFWVVIALGNSIIQWKWDDISFGVSLGLCIVFYFSFAIIGTGIWFVIQYISFEGNSNFRFISSHLIAATIIIAIWLYISSVIVKLLGLHVEGYFKASIPYWLFGGYLLYVVFVISYLAITYYSNFKDKVRKEGELRSLVKEAELHALKSQINPHFLFNSLNSISSLTMSDPGRAQEMVINLSSLMRYSLKHNQNEKVPFREELENIKHYLDIEKVRFGSKLNTVFEIEDKCLSAKIPNMLLQPLYENAIKYGVYEATDPVDVITKCTKNGEFLVITISNEYDPNVITKKGEGIGLRNIKERLQVIFENPGLIQIENSDNIFTVTLSIPQEN